MANMILDDFSPISRGAYGASFAPIFRHKDGTPVNLTGATITMKMQDTTSPTTVKNAIGTWVIDDAANGRTHYNYDPADVNEDGTWTLHFTITIGGKPIPADSKILEILPAV